MLTIKTLSLVHSIEFKTLLPKPEPSSLVLGLTAGQPDLIPLEAFCDDAWIVQ